MAVRIGVVGCGAVAQVQHLPNLLELDEEFEVVVVCEYFGRIGRVRGEALQGP